MASILVSITWWVGQGADITEQRGCLKVGRLAVSRKNWYPQLGWKRNLQLIGYMVPQEIGQTDLVPCLGQQDSFFI